MEHLSLSAVALGLTTPWKGGNTKVRRGHAYVSLFHDLRGHA